MPAEAPWRVYLAEWVAVYTSDSSGPEGADECWDHFERNYKGRVREEHRQVVATSPVKPGAYPYSLELRLPNLKGEFKDEAAAWMLSGELMTLDASPKPHVVRRGSPAEQALLDYGKKMLPAQAGGGDQA